MHRIRFRFRPSLEPCEPRLAPSSAGAAHAHARGHAAPAAIEHVAPNALEVIAPPQVPPSEAGPGLPYEGGLLPPP